MAAVYARLLRASMLDVLGQDFIKVARAKGLREKWVIGRHALKNAVLPAVTMFGMSFGGLLGGSVIIETIFAWPGIGKFAVDSIFNRDYPVIQGYVLFMAVIFVVANLIVDISYGPGSHPPGKEKLRWLEQMAFSSPLDEHLGTGGEIEMKVCCAAHSEGWSKTSSPCWDWYCNLGHSGWDLCPLSDAQ